MLTAQSHHTRDRAIQHNNGHIWHPANNNNQRSASAVTSHTNVTPTVNSNANIVGNTQKSGRAYQIRPNPAQMAPVFGQDLSRHKQPQTHHHQSAAKQALPSSSAAWRAPLDTLDLVSSIIKHSTPPTQTEAFKTHHFNRNIQPGNRINTSLSTFNRNSAATPNHALPTLGQNQNDTCIICDAHPHPHADTSKVQSVTDPKSSPSLFRMPCCQKPFHLDCLYLWRLHNPECPNCSHAMAAPMRSCRCVIRDLVLDIKDALEGILGHDGECEPEEEEECVPVKDADISKSVVEQNRLNEEDDSANSDFSTVDEEQSSAEPVTQSYYFDEADIGDEVLQSEASSVAGDVGCEPIDEGQLSDDSGHDNSGSEDRQQSIIHATQGCVNLSLYSNRPPQWLSSLKCPFCRETFNSQAKLELHLQTTTVHTVRVCCGRVFASEIGLELHRGSEDHVWYQRKHSLPEMEEVGTKVPTGHDSEAQLSETITEDVEHKPEIPPSKPQNPSNNPSDLVSLAPSQIPNRFFCAASSNVPHTVSAKPDPPKQSSTNEVLTAPKSNPTQSLNETMATPVFPSLPEARSNNDHLQRREGSFKAPKPLPMVPVHGEKVRPNQPILKPAATNPTREITKTSLIPPRKAHVGVVAADVPKQAQVKTEPVLPVSTVNQTKQRHQVHPPKTKQSDGNHHEPPIKPPVKIETIIKDRQIVTRESKSNPAQSRNNTMAPPICSSLPKTPSNNDHIQRGESSSKVANPLPMVPKQGEKVPCQQTQAIPQTSASNQLRELTEASAPPRKTYESVVVADVPKQSPINVSSAVSATNQTQPRGHVHPPRTKQTDENRRKPHVKPPVKLETTIKDSPIVAIQAKSNVPKQILLPKKILENSLAAQPTLEISKPTKSEGSPINTTARAIKQEADNDKTPSIKNDSNTQQRTIPVSQKRSTIRLCIFDTIPRHLRPLWFKTLQCPYCSTSFRNQSTLEQHLKETKKHKVITCCGIVFAHEMGLLEHHEHVHLPDSKGGDEMETGPKVNCDVNFNQNETRRTQFDLMTYECMWYEDQPGWFHSCMCPYCYIKVGSLKALEQHIQATRAHEVYVCCGELFATSADYQAHREVEHRDDDSDSESNSDSESYHSLSNSSSSQQSQDDDLAPQTEKSGWAQCTINLEQYNMWPAHKQPVWYKSLTCPYCAIKFETTNLLQFHLRSTAKHPVITCCTKVFVDEEEMKRHRDVVKCAESNFVKVIEFGK